TLSSSSSLSPSINRKFCKDRNSHINLSRPCFVVVHSKSSQLRCRKYLRFCSARDLLTMAPRASRLSEAFRPNLPHFEALHNPLSRLKLLGRFSRIRIDCPVMVNH